MLRLAEGRHGDVHGAHLVRILVQASPQFATVGSAVRSIELAVAAPVPVSGAHRVVRQLEI